jgi:hypothetical protein
VDAIVEARHDEARELVGDHWQAINAMAQVLTRRGRLAGDDLDAALDHALLEVPSIRQREDAFAAQLEAMNVRLGFARPMNYS